MSKLLTITEVANILGKSEKAVYTMTYRGQLQYVKMGNYKNSPIRFRECDIDEYIQKYIVKAYVQN